MKILFNTDNNIDGSQRISDYFSPFIVKKLNRFESQITRVEVFLSDQDGSKSGLDDKKCTLEVRLKSLQPIAVSNQGSTIEDVIKGAVDKIKTALDTTLGRLQEH